MLDPFKHPVGYCGMCLIGLIGSILSSGNMLDLFEHPVGYCWMSLIDSIFSSNIIQNVGSI